MMNKVGIIGLGHVGATTALLMAQRGKVGKMVLVDQNTAKVKSEQLDLQDQIAQLATDTSVVVQDYDSEQWDKITDLDVLIFCPGKIAALIDHGGNRDYELNITSQIVKEVAPKIKASKFAGIIVTITNPCDVIARLLQEQTGFDQQRIVGTGTSLETARMRHAVGAATGHNYHDVQGYVFGEHGDSMFPVWSSVQIAGKPITDFDVNLSQLKQQIVTGGYTIMDGKHYTNNGIATRANLTTEAILSDAKRALPVSAYDPDFKLYIGQLAIVGKNGIEKLVKLSLNKSEQHEYQIASKAIQANYEKVK
ncbi:lactate/malate family dehydrogenase [Bombilactobacillus thymidiniphilus]|uniref:L-lactate dehydrogenase n=1 Tax=Bombilactobacillus thymidiniphilus TaxID=2923363 RepID=A0ABY4PDG1_9LACO|nr:L-lactate dehydrogenase [Bombilactobacillus thymidiniphilus]UQS83747.1 L-lactate dehydrogenase [Bombilactobacillus thymidiniphilus]